jgi:pyruvate/2-oxoglutarate dehydrogenase complex dihydrolipoamide dehydrogenase (E3) component
VGPAQLPKRLVVLGGGPIGCELAQSFARLGSQVTQVEMRRASWCREDEDVSAYAQRALEADGVAVLTGHKALRCERRAREADGGAGRWRRTRLPFDALLCAVGRSARLKGFGLENWASRRSAPCRSTTTCRPSTPTSSPPATWPGPTSSRTPRRTRPGTPASMPVRPLKKFKADYSVIPWCTFIDPEVARVGLNEQEARAQGVAYEVTRYGIDDLDRAIADSAAHGWVKVLTVPGKDRILGVTIVGVHAGDLLAEYVLAMKHGLGLNKILGTIHTYPTLAEANKYAAGEWKRAHQPQGCCAGWQKFHAWRRGA